MQALSETLSRPGDQPGVTCEARGALVADTIGIKLFTLMEVDPERELAWRSHTNMPGAYPLKGEKPFPKNRWAEIVEQNGETFVAHSINEIAEVFPDHELIQSLGCESCLNLPIFIAGQLRGTLNCLHEAGHYTPDRVAAAETLDGFRAEGVEAVAISFLHSHANTAHEEATLAEVQSLWPEVSVVASHQITREWREYERTNTTALPAYVQPVAARY
jgi:hypothetical protein